MRTNDYHLGLPIKGPGVLTIALLLSSCAAHFSCDAPDGFGCKSISEVYALDAQGISAQTEVGDLGTDTTSSSGNSHAESAQHAGQVPPSLSQEPLPGIGALGQPLFREPRRLRIWIVDWEDASGLTYVPNHYVHTQLDNGEWVLPQIRLQLLEALQNKSFSTDAAQPESSDVESTIAGGHHGQ